MSEPLPPIDGSANLTPIGETGTRDSRDINMNRLDSSPAPAQDPNVLHINYADGVRGTATRQPDGSWAFVPEPPPVTPPWLQTPVTKVAGNSLLAGHGLMATLATLATVAIVGVAITSGGHDGWKTGTVPPAVTSDARTPTETGSPGQSIDNTGAAEANRIVTEILKGCLNAEWATQFGLVFEAVPGANLDRVYQAIPNNPDHLFIPDRVAASDLFTVTITATGSRNHGARGQWAVDISTGGVVPLGPTNNDGTPALYFILIGAGCGSIQEMM